MISRGDSIGEVFTHFTTHEWIFESEKVKKLLNLLNEEEKEMYYIDVTRMDWKRYAVIE